MVLDDPPAPAALVEFGFETCADDAPARRLDISVMQNDEYISVSRLRASRACMKSVQTEFVRQEA